MLDLELPAVCDFSVTNVCNAACDFCGFARDKTLTGPRDTSMQTNFPGRCRSCTGAGFDI